MTAWGAGLRHAALAFGIKPAAFWRLSVREWRMLTAPMVRAPERAELEALMARFPD